jgi:hypothetical protein
MPLQLDNPAAATATRKVATRITTRLPTRSRYASATTFVSRTIPCAVVNGFLPTVPASECVASEQCHTSAERRKRTSHLSEDALHQSGFGVGVG